MYLSESETASESTHQDYAAFVHPMGKRPGTALFLVFDGHGQNGDSVSQEVLNSLMFELEDQADVARAKARAPSVVGSGAGARWAGGAELRAGAGTDAVRADGEGASSDELDHHAMTASQPSAADAVVQAQPADAASLTWPETQSQPSMTAFSPPTARKCP